MHTKKRFLAYSNKTHSTLRILLVILVAVLFYIAWEVDFLFLYGAAFVVLIIAAITMSFQYSYVTLSDRGIALKYGSLKTYEIRWEEVQCCGTFSIRILGAEQKEEYIYFSKKPVQYSRLVTGNTLPRQSPDFIFMALQDNILSAVNELWNNTKAKNLVSKNCADHVFEDQRRRISPFWPMAICLVCIVAYLLSRDPRWVVVSVLSVFAQFEMVKGNH